MWWNETPWDIIRGEYAVLKAHYSGAGHMRAAAAHQTPEEP